MTALYTLVAAPTAAGGHPASWPGEHTGPDLTGQGPGFSWAPGPARASDAGPQMGSVDLR